MNLVTQKADLTDLDAIKNFTDFWLAGRGLAKRATGAVNDYFISPTQHKKYILKYETTIVTGSGGILAWAVTQHDGSLIHFLVSGYYRGQGIGKKLLLYLSPGTIHSKSNQSSGDPGKFYEHLGYVKVGSVKSKSRFDINKIRPNRKKIIDIYQKTD